MLKRRVVIVLPLVNGQLYRTKQFQADVHLTSNFLGSDACDEVVILDVERRDEYVPLERRQGFCEAVNNYAMKCMTPLSVGGDIRTLDDVRFALKELGADKIVLGRAMATRLPHQVARRCGVQAVVAGIDFDQYGMVRGHPYPAASWARKCVGHGAGEIFLQSIDRDGSLRGYDLETLGKVTQAVSVPVVIGGGCSGWRDMAKAYAVGADGAATSNIFHMSENALQGFKRELVKVGAQVRA